MMKTEIKIGDYVILNDFDKPCLRLVAKVTGIDYEENWLNAEYICEQTSMKEVGTFINYAWNVKDFGIELSFDEEGFVSYNRVGESIVTYMNHAPRKWQNEYEPFYQKLRK